MPASVYTRESSNEDASGDLAPLRVGGRELPTPAYRQRRRRDCSPAFHSSNGRWTAGENRADSSSGPGPRLPLGKSLTEARYFAISSRTWARCTYTGPAGVLSVRSLWSGFGGIGTEKPPSPRKGTSWVRSGASSVLVELPAVTAGFWACCAVAQPEASASGTQSHPWLLKSTPQLADCSGGFKDSRVHRPAGNYGTKGGRGRPKPEQLLSLCQPPCYPLPEKRRRGRSRAEKTRATPTPDVSGRQDSNLRALGPEGEPRPSTGSTRVQPVGFPRSPELPPEQPTRAGRSETLGRVTQVLPKPVRDRSRRVVGLPLQEAGNGPPDGAGGRRQPPPVHRDRLRALRTWRARAPPGQQRNPAFGPGTWNSSSVECSRTPRRSSGSSSNRAGPDTAGERTVGEERQSFSAAASCEGVPPSALDGVGHRFAHARICQSLAVGDGSRNGVDAAVQRSACTRLQFAWSASQPRAG